MPKRAGQVSNWTATSISPSVFSCRRVAVAVALLVRWDKVGEGRLQRPKANLSRWNLKVTNQAAGPGDLARRDTCLFGRAQRQQKGRQTGLRSSSAMGVPWCRGQGWAVNQARPTPDQSVRVAERGDLGRRERESFAVRWMFQQNPILPAADSKPKGNWELDGRKRSWRAGFALKVRSRCGESVESASVARRCREWSWSRTRWRRGGGWSCSLQRNSGCARVSQADKRMLFDGMQSSRVCSVWNGGRRRRRDEKGRGCQMELRPNEERAPKTLDQGG